MHSLKSNIPFLVLEDAHDSVIATINIIKLLLRKGLEIFHVLNEPTSVLTVKGRSVFNWSCHNVLLLFGAKIRFYSDTFDIMGIFLSHHPTSSDGIDVVLWELFAADVEGVEGIGAIGAVLEQVLLGLRVFLL